MNFDNMEGTNRNVIIGIAFNYTGLELLPFLESLEKTGYKEDLLLFTNNKTSRAATPEYGFNMRCIDVEEELSYTAPIHRALRMIAGWLRLERWWVDLHSKRIIRTLLRKQPFSRWLIGLFYYNFHITAARWAFYYNWVIANDFRQCFFTDVVDVIFQDNIFQRTNTQSVMVFEENGSVRLGTEPVNKGWMEASFGVDGWNEIFNCVVFCAGTILCSRHKGLDFLRDFITEFIRGNKPLEPVGIDQATLNYMVSYNRKEYFVASRNGEVVLTVATEAENDIDFAEGAIILKRKKEAPAVVHQYNRYKKLIQFVQERHIRM